MDSDLLKSPSEDQMDMIMMMQMDRLPEFCEPYADVGDQILSVDFAGGSGSSNAGALQQQIIDGGSPTFVNPPSTISFGGVGGLAEEPAGVHFLSNPSGGGGGRWRGGGGAGDLLPGSSTAYPAQSSSQKRNSMAAMREMIFRIAAMQPIHIDPESVKPPKRRNVKISKDPQSVAARHRRERISERIRILQRLVPGGTKMDTASMLDEAIHYVKFLKTQVQTLERAAANRPAGGIGFPVAMSNGSYLPLPKPYQAAAAQNVNQYSDA